MLICLLVDRPNCIVSIMNAFLPPFVHLGVLNLHAQKCDDLYTAHIALAGHVWHYADANRYRVDET
ncbi:hypothetical protein D6851_03025 [Altericroceibacterium spongiae]|uniref:Uncharacterized protein n=1 Tax=Altericroceibacterium spongiae TaxID=2320269 RepID=A0A420ES53_9SPHN|nr:hypothetical protein D6851_03025 [Altericroceibacterium spongiae]